MTVSSILRLGTPVVGRETTTWVNFLISLKSWSYILYRKKENQDEGMIAETQQWRSVPQRELAIYCTRETQPFLYCALSGIWCGVFFVLLFETVCVSHKISLLNFQQLYYCVYILSSLSHTNIQMKNLIQEHAVQAKRGESSLSLTWLTCAGNRALCSGVCSTAWRTRALRAKGSVSPSPSLSGHLDMGCWNKHTYMHTQVIRDYKRMLH